MKEKIIKGSFIFLCICAYFSLCIELPYLFNYLFNTDAFKNTQAIFGFILIALICFYYNFFYNKQIEEWREKENKIRKEIENGRR